MSRRIIVPVAAEILEQALRLPPGFLIEGATAKVKAGLVTVMLELGSARLPDVETPPEVTPIITRHRERYTWKIGEEEFES